MKIAYACVLATLTTVVVEVVAQEKIIVTGATTGINKETGVAPARLNIIDLYEERGPAW